MLLYVYRLRQRGVRQGRTGMANEGLRGDLRLESTTTGWYGRVLRLARLLDPATGREMLPTLEQAKVVRVRQAMILAGVEAIPRGRKDVDHCRQTWVCTADPVPLDSWPTQRKAPAATGFDPADDDLA